jgi:glycosyltransferase involved in cell wall biosynthesis
MRIAVDGRALSDGSELRGIGTYVRTVVAGLAEAGDLHPIVLAEPEARVPAGVERYTIRRRATHHRLVYREHDLLLTRELGRVRPDVAFAPAQHPLRRCPVPWVQTIHDLIPLRFDHPYFAVDRRRWKQYGPRLRRAHTIITPSRSSADDVIAHFGVIPERVHVIPEAADPSFTTDGPREPPEGAEPYVMFVGGYGPHKGIGDAIDVVGLLADAGLPHRLVLAGPQDDWMRLQIDQLLAGAAHPERVDLVGYVDDLPALYRGASALVWSSRAEGFGLPPLEAMACGTPVIAYANTSAPEVIGDGGILVADGDVAALARSVGSLLGDAAAWREWSARGVDRAGAFSWARTVAAHVEIFRQVLTAG